MSATASGWRCPPRRSSSSTSRSGARPASLCRPPRRAGRLSRALGGRSWVEAANYPALTLLGQSLGSLVLALEAVLRLPPPLFIDTTGYAFSFPIARYVAGCSVACYVHYPTISTDMLAAVAERRPAHNNAASIASSPARSQLKLLYYKLFARLYALVGRRADVVMARTLLPSPPLQTDAGWLAGGALTRLSAGVPAGQLLLDAGSHLRAVGGGGGGGEGLPALQHRRLSGAAPRRRRSVRPSLLLAALRLQSQSHS